MIRETGCQRRMAAVLLAVVAVELYASRFHFLDDAFIHLRIAHNLLDYGRFVYNRAGNDSGSSSPLYTTLLAAASLVSRSPIVPKVINVIIYLSLFAAVARAWTAASGIRRDLLLAALVAISSPFAIRWLSDGMETGLVAAVAIGLAVSTQRVSARREPPSLSVFSAVGLLGAAAVWLRIEFLFVLALAVTGISLTRLVAVSEPAAPTRVRDTWSRVAPFIGGAMAGVLGHAAVFGHLLPDTAIAKRLASMPIDVRGTLETVVRLHASASLFGAAVLCLWLVSAFLVLSRARRDHRVLVAAVNAGSPLFIVLLALLCHLRSGAFRRKLSSIWSSRRLCTT